MKEYKCVYVVIPPPNTAQPEDFVKQTIANYEKKGWHLHNYQAANNNTTGHIHRFILLDRETGVKAS